MDEKKWTKREIYNELLTLARTGKMDLDEATLEAFCIRQIAILDNKEAKAKELAAKKRSAGDELTKAIEAVLSDEFEPIAEIAAKVDMEDVTVSKCVYRLNKLVEAGKAEKADIELPAAEGKKARVVKGYKAVQYPEPMDSVEE
jgi:hypothetical protein